MFNKEMNPKMAIEIMLDQLATIIISIGLIVAAFLAVHLDEAIYAVGSLAFTLILLAVLYWIYNAIFAAIFQLVAGISTLMVLFLAGEMLSEKSPAERTSKKQVFVAIIIGLIIAVPLMLSLFYTATSMTPLPSAGTFTNDIWSARSIDIVLQGLVILVIAVGVAIILYQKKVEVAAAKKAE